MGDIRQGKKGSTAEDRGVVLSLSEERERLRRVMPGLGRTRGRVESVGGADAWLNTQWDHMLVLAESAWTWRDSETMASLRTVVLALERHVSREWSA